MVSRRAALAIGGAGVAGTVAIGLSLRGEQPAAGNPDTVGFFGAHQAGITTPAQERLYFAAFDVVTQDRDKLIQLLKDWTAAAARLTQGKDAGLLGAVGGQAEAPPDDTGEAIGLSASSLTLTVGFGPSLFTRFGLSAQKPAALEDLPHFAGDMLRPEISGGDICVQACANDPQVALHAIRNLARIGFGVVSVRYGQMGFISRGQETPRNLMGFKDGTANKVVDDTLWAQAGDGPKWMDGGSYLVTRRIRMIVETWDRTSLQEQETIIGRDKREGAPLGQKLEHDEPDFTGTAIEKDAHLRLAHPTSNNGARLLRRGYNFADGSDNLGRLDAGLFFMAYQRDPRKAFVPVQRNLSRTDRLNEYIRHTSSGLWAVPPGVAGPQDFWGSGLFA